MIPDLGFCPLAAEAAMALLSISASVSGAHPSCGMNEVGEERHQPLTSSTQPPTGSIGGGEPQPLPIPAAAFETPELEEEASRRVAAPARRGRGRPRAGAARGSQSEALRPPGRARGTGHGGSSHRSREEEEERHRSSRSSTQPPTGSIGSGEPQLLPTPAAVCETRELEEEASRREAAAAGRGRGRPRAGAARGSQSEALRPPGRAYGAGHGGSLHPPREEERHRSSRSSTQPPTGTVGSGEPQLLPMSAAVCETSELEEEASQREAVAAGRSRRRPFSGAPSGESEAPLRHPGRARRAAYGGSSRGSSGVRSGPRRHREGAGMGRQGSGEARGGAVAIAAINHGEASAALGVTHDNEAVSDEDESEDSQYFLGVIESLKTEFTKENLTYIKNRVKENKWRLSRVTHKTSNSSKVWQRNTSIGTNVVSNLLTSRQDDALCSVHSLGVSPAEKDGVSSQEESLNSTTVMLGGNLTAKNAIVPIKLPEVLKHPPYTTWTFVYRNQQMAEDQSVFGRRKIYHDANCGEALICSDSEDEAVEDEEEKKEFKGSEDFIIWRTIEEYSMSDAVLKALARYFDRASGDIKARYEILHGEKTEGSVKEMSKPNAEVEDVYCDKDLDAALDSFDNLFCRRCLVFDCRLHGCSQDLVFPAEKQSPWNSMDDGITCGIHCYKLASKLDATTPIDPHMVIDTEPTCSLDNTRTQLASNKKKQVSSGRNAESQQNENSSTQRVASESSDSEVHPTSNKSPHQIRLKGRIKKRTKKRIAERIHMTLKKKRREVTLLDSRTGGCPSLRDMKLRSRTLDGHKDSVASSQQNYPSTRSSWKKDAPQREKNTALAEDHSDPTEGTNNEHTATYGHDSSREKEFVDGNIFRQEDNDRSWKVIEQGLLLKGLEIFGRNSCLIARNLLSGMKSCSDIFQYMNYMENRASGVLSGVDSLVKGHIKGPELSVRSRFFKRRRRVRRLKDTSKSAGYHVIRKRIAESKSQLYQQYNPCGCQSACGKECPCLTNETCCEKYCGCPKTCKNRFRGCHCAKSQCRSRQCPCFAADRECDPDVCRNCWVGCGDGSLGFPNQRGDNYECRNMKVLLKKQQRILLGRSDVCGWGAFLKNTVGKDEYIGEYTGELISHTEAGMRGKVYDRENSSFLFNLNNEFVLDALRMGNKLKYANHSNDPNCYAKVMLVAGDHRVGIFAKERIGTGEEIFYDYHYAPDEAPAWALKPDAPGAKEPGESSSARGKKPAH